MDSLCGTRLVGCRGSPPHLNRGLSKFSCAISVAFTLAFRVFIVKITQCVTNGILCCCHDKVMIF